MLYGLNLTWHWSPIALGGLVILCLFYVFAAQFARRRNTQDKLKGRHMLAFITAIFLLAIVFLTPLDTVARTQLFAAHMVQAIMLTTLCAPLLYAATPAWLLSPLMSQPITRMIARVLTQPVIASVIFNVTFLVWHAPSLYNLALAQGTLYHVELLTILLTSLLNWWPLIGPLRELHKMSYPAQMLYAFLDGQPVDIFAFLVVFTGTVFYTHYHIPTQLQQWGYNAVADQTVAGAFLLVPGLVDLIVMTPLFFRWLGQIEARAKLSDQRRQERADADAALLAAEDAEGSSA